MKPSPKTLRMVGRKHQQLSVAIIAVPKLYTQVLHLMNKMNLPPPFGPLRKQPPFPLETVGNQVARVDELKDYGESKINPKRAYPEEEEEEEEEEENNKEGTTANSFLEKRPTLSSSSDVNSNPFNKTDSSVTFFTPEQTTSTNTGVVSVENKGIQSLFIQPAAVRTCISRQDILKHRISKEEMAQQKAFANYSYGEPSTKLYLRNMAKDITEDDLLQLFGCFFDRDEIAKE